MNEKKRSEATSFLGHWMFRVGYWVFSKDTTNPETGLCPSQMPAASQGPQAASLIGRHRGRFQPRSQKMKKHVMVSFFSVE